MEAEYANFDVSRIALLNVSQGGLSWCQGVCHDVLTRRERDRAILVQRILHSH